MNVDGIRGQDGVPEMSSAISFFDADDPSAWTSGEVLRLLLVPTIATALFVGGIYWIRLQLPARPASREQASMVQVYLLSHPAPALIPLRPASQPTAASLASQTDLSVESPDRVSVDTTAVTPIRESAPMELSVLGFRSAPSPMEAPPTSAILRFQQVLLRHIARHQRYPNAARLARLRGAVETFFSVQRDGTLLGVWVKTSSGEAVLDREAVDAIRRAQPLPLIPSELSDRLNVQVTLVFEPS
jgi:periplasmic protein TonB